MPIKSIATPKYLKFIIYIIYPLIYLSIKLRNFGIAVYVFSLIKIFNKIYSKSSVFLLIVLKLVEMRDLEIKYENKRIVQTKSRIFL